jgi:glycine cleavage system regulatory protein
MLNFKEFCELNESEYYKITRDDIQAIWKETDLNKKKEKALDLINKLAGKDKVGIIKIIDKIKEAAKGNIIDKIMANVMLSGSGLKVIAESEEEK